ncbi:hypothetical protein OG21DRAFT_507966 [Imleria badia]|nr:hypothetical protein OG21DRAFT_507966 [Imleria badia]
MSSVLPSALELLWMNDYITLVIVTAVTYDYVLTFSREVDYVWHRSWTLVSTMFVLIRYVGLCFAIVASLDGSAFVPGFASVKVSTALSLMSYWLCPIFLAATDFVMILRVYALWNRARWILNILLLIYVPQIISFLIVQGIYDNPNAYLKVGVVQLTSTGSSKYYCTVTTSTASIAVFLPTIYSLIPRFVMGVTLLLLAVIQTCKQSLQMYRATKRWQPNRYMQQLVKDGIIYFLMNLHYNFVPVESEIYTTNKTAIFLQLFINLLSYITLFPVMPRFIISIRELYDHDLHGCRQGVDTGFGMLSKPVADENTAMSAIAFVDVTPLADQDQGHVMEGDDSEVIRLEELGDGTRRV